MRAVTGATDKVVIVGAGLSGLSAALHLLGAGRQVTLLERDPTPGGRMGILPGPGYQMDSGATVLTMPELVYDALAAVGLGPEDTSPPLRISRLDPSYHARFPDGDHLNVHSDPDAMAQEIARVFGQREVDGYVRLRAWLERMFTAEFDRFMDSNFDSPLDMVGSPAAVADLVRVTALGGFGRLGPKVASFITDPRLQRVFTFQALYAGLAPRRALSVYGAIPHMDTSLGVYFPEGGMAAVTLALADAFTSAGGVLELGADVSGVDFAGDRASAVRTADGRAFACDSLILTPDLPVVDALLARSSARWPRRGTRWSPSAVVLHGTVDRSTSQHWGAPHHHTIDFGDAWEQTFAEITARRGRGRLMSDPSLLVTRPGLSDPGLNLPGNRELLSVLAPCPNLDSAPLAWDNLAGPYSAEILTTLEGRGYHGIADHRSGFQVDRVLTPASWRAQGMGAGSPFAAAHTFPQTGPFRRPNLVRGLQNVVLAGSSTTPGVGVPTTLISGRLAAQRIVGGRAELARVSNSRRTAAILGGRSRPQHRATRPREYLGENHN
ncbi:phytoene desaturase family protein [Tomitella biformata]|uniref:phytoene desaturase family protein n=1 Tax=Tomitella biformata TaxID=630403 RepID=UPI000463EDD4|nr:phytoene desaturase family protein [Tomitella biformata]